MFELWDRGKENNAFSSYFSSADPFAPSSSTVERCEELSNDIFQRALRGAAGGVGCGSLALRLIN